MKIKKIFICILVCTLMLSCGLALSACKEEGVNVHNDMIFTTNSDGTLAFSGLKKEMKNVVIPATVDNIKVTKVNTKAFENFPNVESIEVSKGIKYINANAFSNMNKLKEIKLNEGILSIGTQSFRNCTSLEEVIIPESVRSIGNNVFNGCESLRKVVFPEKCTNIGDLTLANCRDLEEVSINLEEITFSSLFFMNGSEDLNDGFPRYLSKVNVFGTKVYDSAFKDMERIGEVVLSDTIEEIKDNAFINAKIDKNIKLSSNLKIIGESAFENCSGIYSLDLMNYDGKISHRAFADCPNLKEVKFPLNYNRKLHSNAMLTGSYNIEKLYLPLNDPQVYGVESFFERDAYVNAIPPKLKTIVVYDDGIETIKMNFFKSLYRLETVELPSSVTTIEDYAFAFCYNLQNIDLSNIKSIGQNSFYDCKDLNNIDLSNVNTLGYQSFMNCYSLDNVNLENTITIESNVFMNCTNLTNVLLSNKLQSIGNSAFSNCSTLKEITIPNSCLQMGSNVFDEDCIGLTTIICEFESMPNGWNEKWNTSQAKVVWQKN